MDSCLPLIPQVYTSYIHVFLFAVSVYGQGRIPCGWTRWAIAHPNIYHIYNTERVKQVKSLNPYSKFNSTNLLSYTASPLPSGLYSTAQCKFPDLLVEISVTSGSGQSAYPCHLGHFSGSHETTRLSKTHR